jgi:hypothetical protein
MGLNVIHVAEVPRAERAAFGQSVSRTANSTLVSAPE